MTRPPRRFAPSAARCRPSTHDPDRTIMVRAGRGDYRVTPAEARSLARDLLAAAGPPNTVEATEACVWCGAGRAALLLCEPCKSVLSSFRGNSG